MKVKCTTDEWNFFTFGKEYDVISEENGWYFVHDDEGKECYLWSDECEVIDESAQKPTREFKVGDKVKIVKKFSECDICHHGEAWTDCWVPEMDETIGEVGTIIHIMYNGYNVALGGSNWKYPSDSLELVQKFEHLVEELEITKDITYQEFLDAFDYDDSPYVEINKEKVVIGIVDNRLECTTKQREQEVMKALIMLYGKREGEN